MIMLKRILNLKFILLFISVVLVIFIGYFSTFQNRPQTKNSGIDTDAELAFYKNDSLHLSFQYPKSFFVREEKRYDRSVVALTPLAKDNILNHSSVGISSTFLIEFYPGENIDSKSPLRTQATNNAAFREEAVVIDGISSIHQYYNNAYSGDQNEIWFIPCARDNKGVFAIGFMDGALTEQYRSVVRSLKICR